MSDCRVTALRTQLNEQGVSYVLFTYLLTVLCFVDPLVQALMLDRSNHLLHLNYCITLCGMPAEGPGQDREDREREAADHFRRHDELFNALPPEVQEADAEVLAQRRAVSALLGIPISAGTTRAGGSGSSGGGGGGSGSGAGTGASDGASIARDAASYPGSPTAGSRF